MIGARADFRRRPSPTIVIAAACLFTLFGVATRSDAFHFFRGDDSGGCGSLCCPTTGNITDDPGPSGVIGATVLVEHDNYNDPLSPAVHIKAGQAVQWKWASSHCHSVTADNGTSFDSGFYYPATPPANQPIKVIPGFFDYPLFDPDPSLAYTHTFTTPGTYPYHCVHHAVIGMRGMIVVDP